MTAVALAALMIGLFAWLRADLVGMRKELRAEIAEQGKTLRAEIAEQGKTLRAEIALLTQEVGRLRERMAHMEGLLEGLREAISGKQVSIGALLDQVRLLQRPQHRALHQEVGHQAAVAGQALQFVPDLGSFPPALHPVTPVVPVGPDLHLVEGD